MPVNTEKQTIVINGSARTDGATSQLVEKRFNQSAIRHIFLCEHNIEHYSYYGQYTETDRFVGIISDLLEAEHIVLATPVYWYAMSGHMKVFFDRLTQLITTRKDLGYQLKGKTCELVATGSDAQLPAGFEIPFHRTAEYLGMIYEGGTYRSQDSVRIHV